MAPELTRSGVAVMALFWLRWKLRSKERKWLMCLCLSLYRHIHHIPVNTFGSMRPRGQPALHRLRDRG